MAMIKKYYKVIIAVVLILIIFLIINQLTSHSQKALDFRNDKIKTELIKEAKNFNDLFELTEEVKLEGKLIGSIKKIKMMPSGHFGVIDESSKQLNIFSSRGKFIKSIGGIGKGPGEYLYAVDFTFDNEGNIFILDPILYNIYYFDKQGNYRWSMKIIDQAENILVVDDKLYLYTTLNMLDRPSGACYDLTTGEKLFEFAYPTEYIKLLIENKYISLLLNSKSADIYKNKIYLINPYQYAIREFDLEGNEKKLIYGESKYFIPYDSLKEFHPFSISPKNFFKSALNGLSLWNDIIIISFLNNEMKKIFVDFYTLNGYKMNNNSIEMPQILFNQNSFYPFYVDSENIFYSYYQPQPDSLNVLPNPVIVKYKCLALRD
ncbi:MAG: 6-bladed beta-propeller [Ignavibacterium sp.]